MNQGKMQSVRRRSGVGTGTTSLLMIFTVLCFVTLSMLSLTTALRNYSMQNRGMQTAGSVAVARGQAARRMARLDEELYALREEATDEDAYYAAALATAEGVGFVAGSEENHVVLLTQVDDKNELLTELLLEAPSQPYRYSLVRQETRLIGGWQPEMEGELWKSE